MAGPLFVELDAPRFTLHVDQACHQAGTVHPDLPPGEVAGDRGQLALLANALFVARETKRRKAAENNKDYRDRAHL